MPNAQIKTIVKKYANVLRKENYPFLNLYLFGSYAKGRAHKWSDIDIAIVTDHIKRNRMNNSFLLWKMRRKVDTRIEPHSFTKKEFANNADPIVHEIKKTGIRIV